MQARAIFEAQIEVENETGIMPIAEIMIPLVSSAKELEILKAAIARVADAVAAMGVAPEYIVGTMIELRTRRKIKLETWYLRRTWR